MKIKAVLSFPVGSGIGTEQAAFIILKIYLNNSADESESLFGFCPSGKRPVIESNPFQNDKITPTIEEIAPPYV